MRAKGPAIAFAAMALAAVGGAGAFLVMDQRPYSGALAEAGRDVPASSPSAAMPNGDGRIFLSNDDARRAEAQNLLPPATRSILDIQQTLKHGEFRWNDEGVDAGPLAIRVDIDRQLLAAYRGGHEIGVAVVLFGADGKPTPLGRFPIKDKREDYHSRTYDAPMPYSLWLTDDGVAVHGSSVRDGRATNGCVGLPLEFARLLFGAAQVGDIVEIVASASILDGQVSS